MRQIVLDTETTGLEPAQNHRIIEIGCVEMVDRRLTGNTFHQYLNPERAIDEGAVEVHGITLESLADKPRFGDILPDFLDYIRGAELIIHNASFDVGFLNHELRRVDPDGVRIEELCAVVDTLTLARRLHPGQRNSLDALCRRYAVDNSHRDLHGALLDAEILAEVYLAMTGGQTSLSLESGFDEAGVEGSAAPRRLAADRPPLRIVRATADELALHEARLARLGPGCVWRRPGDDPAGAR